MPSSGPEVLAPAPRSPDQPFWDPEAQTFDPERRRALQLERVRAMVRAILETPVPLFARKLAAAGIAHPEDLADVEDLSAVPTTVKQELRDAEAEHPPLGDYRFTGLDRCARIGTSTGTTGTPTIAMLSRHDLWIEYESAARNYWRSGWRPGAVVTHCHPAYLYGGGLMLSGTLEYFGFCNLWVPPPDTPELARQAIEIWQRIRPDHQMVALSQNRFQEEAAALGIDLWDDIGFPRFQMGGFGGPGFPLMTAGVECYAYLGGPNDVSDGALLHEDWAVVSAVDPATGRDVPDGQWGNLVVTTLDRDNGLLRYDLEEAAMIDSSPCPSGETTRRGFWGGRFKDLLSSQGRHVQLPELEAAIGSVPAVRTPSLEFVVVRPGGGPEPLQVRVEVGTDDGDRASIADQVAAAISDRVGLRADVEVVDRGTLPRQGYKQRRVIDD